MNNHILGPALYISPAFAVPAGFPFIAETITLPTAIQLLPGTEYIATIEQGGYANTSNLEFGISTGIYSGGEYVSTLGFASDPAATWTTTTQNCHGHRLFRDLCPRAGVVDSARVPDA